MIQIARDHLKGKMAIPAHSKPLFEETETHYVVTFALILPPGVLGPDYTAKVWIKKNTLKVDRMLAGS